MRVGLVIYGDLDTLSGGFLYDRILVDHLRANGDDVEIVSIPWRSYGKLLTDGWSAALRSRLESLDVDVLLQDELNHPSLFRLNRAVRRRWPIVSIVHHLRSSEKRPAWQNRAYRVVERRYLNSVDGFVFNSRTTAETVHALAGAARPFVVAYPAGDRLKGGLPPETVVARAHESGPLRILFLGNVIARKEPDVLLDALSRMPTGGWRLDVVGGIDVEPAYVRRVRRRADRVSGGEGRVVFHGAVVDDSLRNHLAAAHVLAVPSSYEGFGIVYLEGMAFGLPAIATTAGAAHEIVTHGEDGFLIAPGDVVALAGHLSDLMADRGLLARMGTAALTRYAGRPSWEDSAAKIREFLVSMVSGDHGDS